MNRIKLVVILTVLGIGTYVLMSSIYTVSAPNRPTVSSITAAGFGVSTQ
jgi:hypothetical protein